MDLKNKEATKQKKKKPAQQQHRLQEGRLRQKELEGMLTERDNTGLWALTLTVYDSCTWRPLQAMMPNVTGNTGLDAAFCVDVINLDQQPLGLSSIM